MSTWPSFAHPLPEARLYIFGIAPLPPPAPLTLPSPPLPLIGSTRTAAATWTRMRPRRWCVGLPLACHMCKCMRSPLYCVLCTLTSAPHHSIPSPPCPPPLPALIPSVRPLTSPPQVRGLQKTAEEGQHARFACAQAAARARRDATKLAVSSAAPLPEIVKPPTPRARPSLSRHARRPTRRSVGACRQVGARAIDRPGDRVVHDQVSYRPCFT